MPTPNKKNWKESLPPIPEGCNVPLSGPIKLQGRVAIITGAGGGIGQATSYALAQAGAKLCISDVIACDETTEGLNAVGADFIYVKTDVTREEDCNKQANLTLERYGRIDILLNCAGVLELTPIEKLSLEEWNRVIGVDLTGTFLSTKAVWNIMKRQKSGKIICLSSTAARIGGGLSGPHYVAAKAGISGFVKWCAKYGAPDGILVNAIAPAVVWTPMTLGVPYPESAAPIGRFGRVEDVAEPILFLASDMSNLITGCVLDVNGGIWMSP
jgi:3-oxoacyl-[acyl-carrier protein] reductase